MESSLNIQKIVKPSFAVIGIEGSTDDGEGFIPMLWSDANAHFDEVSPVASRDENGALLRLFPLTGRTHQIRVHLASVGCPLKYDFLYGKEEEGKHFLLHCERLEFCRPFSKERLTLTAPAHFE